MKPGDPIRLCLLSLLAAALLWGALPTSGAGASSGLRFLGCLSGKLPPVKQPRVPRPGGCKLTRAAHLDSTGSGMDHVFGLTASPDGRSLYALSSRQDSVLGFSAKPLGLKECFSGITELGRRGSKACALFPHSGTEDANTGFNEVKFATVSPDGRSLYTVSGEGAIGIFSRKPGTGKLTYKYCLTGGEGPNSASQGGVCKTIPTAKRTYDGLDSGLGGIASLAVSPDNRFVYVAATGEAAITTMVRSADGSLSFRDCVAGGSRYVVEVTSPCTVLPLSDDNPHWSGLRGVSQIVISGDGASLYASAPKTSSIAEFQRDPSTGALTYNGCITGDYGRGTGPGDPCKPIPTAQEAGFDSGMFLIKQLQLSADGRSLYGLARGDDAIDSFSRDPATGSLTYTGCLTGNSGLGEELSATGNPCAPLPGAGHLGEGSGIAQPSALALDPSGRNLIVASLKDSALSRFARDPASGALSFKGCLTASTKAARPAGACKLAKGKGGAHQLGFAGLSSLVFAGGKLYATASNQSAVSQFSLSGP